MSCAPLPAVVVHGCGAGMSKCYSMGYISGANMLEGKLQKGMTPSTGIILECDAHQCLHSQKESQQVPASLAVTFRLVSLHMSPVKADYPFLMVLYFLKCNHHCFSKSGILGVGLTYPESRNWVGFFISLLFMVHHAWGEVFLGKTMSLSILMLPSLLWKHC